MGKPPAIGAALLGRSRETPNRRGTETPLFAERDPVHGRAQRVDIHHGCLRGSLFRVHRASRTAGCLLLQRRRPVAGRSNERFSHPDAHRYRLLVP